MRRWVANLRRATVRRPRSTRVRDLSAHASQEVHWVCGDAPEEQSPACVRPSKLFRLRRRKELTRDAGYLGPCGLYPDAIPTSFCQFLSCLPEELGHIRRKESLDKHHHLHRYPVPVCISDKETCRTGIFQCRQAGNCQLYQAPLPTARRVIDSTPRVRPRCDRLLDRKWVPHGKVPFGGDCFCRELTAIQASQTL